MPMFYIGSSSVSKVNNGYHGSVASKQYKQVWKAEIKDKPELFKTVIVSICKTRQEAIEREYVFHKKLSVVNSQLYINQANAIIDGCFGQSNSGKNNSQYGKHRPDASERMTKQNPMFSREVALKVARSKKESRMKGQHKSTRNRDITLIKHSERMKMNNPSTIKCCCILCRQECNTSSLTRFHKHLEQL